MLQFDVSLDGTRQRNSSTELVNGTRQRNSFTELHFTSSDTLFDIKY